MKIDSQQFYEMLSKGGIRVAYTGINGEMSGIAFVTKPVAFDPYQVIERDMKIPMVSETGKESSIRLDDLSYLVGLYGKHVCPWGLCL